MTLKRLRRHWDVLGKKDPLWAVLASDDKRGNRWRVDEFFATGQGEIAEVTKYVEALGLELDHRNALDFGCGVGRLTQALADRFEVVWGVDIAPSMIAQAKQYDRHPGTCHYILNERADLQMFESASFGFIYSNIALQHIEPRYQRSYLREFVRVLTPGGVLVFQLPSERIERRSGTRGRFKQTVESITPPPIISAYKRIRWGRRALIKMWGMPRDEVTELLRAEGATMLDVRVDRFAGANWAGFRYTVTK
jgi:ubiquinone/menaquinone biosynthesis C-methylase UbiE